MGNLIFFAKENTHLERHGYLDFGWGNGYVAIPEGHPMHKMDYDAIHDNYQIDVNGGLTFSRIASDLSKWELPEGIKDTDWIIGFDTMHSWDSLQEWPNEHSVLREAEKLANQCQQLEPIKS